MGEHMGRTVHELATQLESWGRAIREIADRTDRAVGAVKFDDLMYVDELKALHVIATAKLDVYRSAPSAERESVAHELESIWAELELALGPPRALGPGQSGSPRV